MYNRKNYVNIKCMSKNILYVLILVSFSLPAFAVESTNDAAIKKQIIAASIASYPSKCPCPYNVTKNGSRCGGRSAYSKPGGYAPVCFESDVTPEMVKAYKKR